MRWYALKCDTSGELDAMQAVCIGGLQAFVPMERRQVREGRRRRPKTIRTIMLPGYVLAKMPHGYAARHVPIVRGVVCMDGEPIPLPERDVLDLMQGSRELPQPTRKERRLARYLRRIEAQRRDWPAPRMPARMRT
jgi:transcription antitermination factor NusG